MAVIVKKCPIRFTASLSLHGRDDLVVSSDSQPDVDGRVSLHQPGPFFFDVTSRHGQNLIRPFKLSGDEFSDDAVRFLPSRPDETAGVDDDDVGFLGIRDERESVLFQ